MIYDTLDNIMMYCKDGDVMFKAIQYALDFDLSQPDGEYEVEGDRIFARVQAYDTSVAEERKFESHKKYFDIQILREGRERVDIALAEDLDPLTPYDEAKDVVKLKAPKFFSSIILDSRRFAIFYPHDIHRPNCNLEGKCNVRKICMKVKL